MTDTSRLHDFHPGSAPTEGLCREISTLLSRSRRNRRPCERDAFIALLAGVPALRKTPGLPAAGAAGPDFFTTLPLCATEADTAACRITPRFTSRRNRLVPPEKRPTRSMLNAGPCP